MLDAVWFFCAFKQFRDVLRVEWFIIYLFVNLLIDDVAHTKIYHIKQLQIIVQETRQTNMQVKNCKITCYEKLRKLKI